MRNVESFASRLVVVFLGFVILAVAFTGCGSNDEQPASDSGYNSDGAHNRPPSFQGLRLGMHIKTAAATMAKLDLTTSRYGKWKSNFVKEDGSLQYDEMYDRKYIGEFGALQIYPDKEGRVEEIVVWNSIIPIIFNWASLQHVAKNDSLAALEEWKRIFMMGEGIPFLNPLKYPIAPGGGTYVNHENGWIVTINEDRDLTVKLITCGLD